MAFINGEATVSTGPVDILGIGSMLMGSPALVTFNIAITGNLLEPTFVKSARAISSTRIRIDFSAPVLNNAALADVRNYGLTPLNGAAQLAVQSVDVPSSLQALSVDLIVSEMTQAGSVANYLVSVNSDRIELGPELVVDGNMEAAGTTAWTNAFNSGGLTKVAGSPSGSGTQAGRLTGVGTGFRGVFQSGLMSFGSHYRVSAWMRSINGDGKPFIATGSPAASGDCIFYGGTSITYAFQQIDFTPPNVANNDRIMIGRDTAVAASVQAEADELSLRKWVGAGGGPVEILDAISQPLISDPVPLFGKGVAPEIFLAYSTSSTTIVVQFNEKILDLVGSVRTAGAYTANLGLTIQSVIEVGPSSVTLKTSEQIPGQLYTLTLTGTWFDIALNQMSSPSATPVLGFITPAAQEALLNLKMYNFLIEGIRIADQSDEGARFLERFVTGPQAIWAMIVQSIFDLPKIWSASDAPDEVLHFLKRIVGWTQELDPITNALDFATLRRLIKASARFWKTRGPESSVEDLIRITTAARSYIINWFQHRFILDEVYAGEEHGIGTDPWLLSTPYEGAPDAWTYNIRIVDDGSLDRALVRELAKLTRPTGERVLITYLGFLDLFETDGDETQWEFATNANMPRTIENGRLRLDSLASTQQRFLVINENNQDWTSYVVSWTFKTNFSVLQLIFYGVGDPSNPGSLVDYYFIEVGTENSVGNESQIRLRKSVADVRTTLALVDLPSAIGERLDFDATYTIRVEISPKQAGSLLNSVSVYLDNERLILHESDTTFTQGTIGMQPVSGAAGRFLELYDMEMFFVPLATDFIDLGNVVAGPDDLRGPELCVDPTFDNPAAWEVSSNVVVQNGRIEVTTEAFSGRVCRHQAILESGVAYEVQFTVSNLVGGTCIPRFTSPDGNSVFDGVSVAANGVYNQTIVSPFSGLCKIGLRFANTSQMYVDNFSVKKILWEPE